MPALPDPDTAVGLPVDRLAMVLLQRLDNSGFQGRDNIIGGEVSRYCTASTIDDPDDVGMAGR
ncbi:MAG: hypothetical protein M3370_02110 [Actinomycetota bacterium]|nr:hypothetical protein [Actinomycetota bacterium]